MAHVEAPNGIVLYWYKASPYGRRVAWYLALRNIAYAQCLQPPYLPRPDLDALGIQYRRSPIMAIGRDVYVDSRLMISKLDSLFPASASHPGLSHPQHAGLASLLQKLSTESAFSQVVRLIPAENPLMQDAKFLKDREQFGGGRGIKASPAARQEATVHMQQIFAILESLLADGRPWIAGTEEPSLADLEGVWPIDWLIGLRPPREHFSAERFPRVYAWHARFRAAVKSKSSAQAAAVPSLTGVQATPLVLNAAFAEPPHLSSVDETDPMRLRAGEVVEVFPTDGGGFFHQDRGTLVGLSAGEVVIVKSVRDDMGGEREVRLHAPRWQFRIRRVKAKEESGGGGGGGGEAKL